MKTVISSLALISIIVFSSIYYMKPPTYAGGFEASFVYYVVGGEKHFRTVYVNESGNPEKEFRNRTKKGTEFARVELGDKHGDAVLVYYYTSGSGSYHEYSFGNRSRVYRNGSIIGLPLDSNGHARITIPGYYTFRYYVNGSGNYGFTLQVYPHGELPVDTAIIEPIDEVSTAVEVRLDQDLVREALIAPNPVTGGSVNIDLAFSKTIPFSVTAYSLDGKEYRMVADSEGTNLSRLVDVSTWPSGIYIAVVRSEDEVVFRKKVVVQN